MFHQRSKIAEARMPSTSDDAAKQAGCVGMMIVMRMQRTRQRPFDVRVVL